MKKHSKHAFTLIELLTVIAIIGILAGILIPAVASVKKQANVAASKSQLANYISATELYKSEYKFYPFLSGAADNGNIRINNPDIEFVETLSGKKADGTPSAGWNERNRRRINFYTFNESEFYLNSSGKPSDDIVADRFNNQEIFFAIDGDGDGFVRPDVAADAVRVSVTAYVEENDEGGPSYELWDE